MKLGRMMLVAGVVLATGSKLMAKPCDPPQRAAQTATETTHHSSGCKVLVLEKLALLTLPVHEKVDVCSAELDAARAAVKVATDERDNASLELEAAMARLDCGARLLKAMCETVCIDGVTYTKEEVAAAVNSLLCDYRHAKVVLETREKSLAERVRTTHAVEVRVAKWRKAERELLNQIALLKAEHDLQSAQSSSQPTSSVDQVVRAEQLVAEIQSMLPKTETQQSVMVAKPNTDVRGDGSSDGSDSLLKEVDAIIEGQDR